MKLQSTVLGIVTVVWHHGATFSWAFQQFPLFSYGSHRRITTVDGGQPLVAVSTFVGSFNKDNIVPRTPYSLMTALGLATSDDGTEEYTLETTTMTPEEEEEEQEVRVKEVGNLVVNDEWEGLTMELTEVIRTAVMEDIKAKSREFLGKDNYEIGDLSKEIDARVKTEVANLRGKEVTYR
jgi:hypothetical protein